MTKCPEPRGTSRCLPRGWCVRRICPWIPQPFLAKEVDHATRLPRRSELLSRSCPSGVEATLSEAQVKRGRRVVHGDKELQEKLGRNDLCPCGSGRLFKRCCRNSGFFSTGLRGTITRDRVTGYGVTKGCHTLKCHLPSPGELRCPGVSECRGIPRGYRERAMLVRFMRQSLESDRSLRCSELLQPDHKYPAIDSLSCRAHRSRISRALPFGLALRRRRAWQIVLFFKSTSIVITRCRRTSFSIRIDQMDDARPARRGHSLPRNAASQALPDRARHCSATPGLSKSEAARDPDCPSQ